jgi:hypothetical protein
MDPRLPHHQQSAAKCGIKKFVAKSKCTLLQNVLCLSICLSGAKQKLLARAVVP